MPKDYLEYSVEELLKEYKDGNPEPLDGDEVERFVEIIKCKINLREGNITEKEYDTLLDSRCKLKRN